MVTMDKLSILGFGRFQDREFNLSPGLNVVYGGNEAGKSTIHSFIEAMLFGFWTPNLPHLEPDPGREKYRPWQGETYGGEIEYTWPGGKVRIIRDFSANTVTLMNPKSGEALEGIPLNNWGEPDYARIHFGCSKLVFRNTVSISQLGSATDTAVALEVRNLLSNLAQSGGSGISVKQGLEILREARRQTDFERVKNEAMRDQIVIRIAEAQRRTKEAAQIEIQQFRNTRDLERLGRERRQLKDLAQQVQGQVAANKLERLEGLRHRAGTIQAELAQLSNPVNPETLEQWTDLQAELERAREVHKLHVEALEEVANRSTHLEGQIQELASYQNFDKDTLIEMSSAWQMQAKGQQVMEELQGQLTALGAEIREVTTELAKLPYFRPDALEQAAALEAQARGGGVQLSQEDLDQELVQLERSLNLRKGLRWAASLSLPVIAAAAWVLQPLAAAAAIPILGGIILLNSSAKKINLRCRNLRRELYTLEMDYLNSQRQREQSSRELSAHYARAGVDSMRELEEKYHSFISLSDRNRDLLREQKYITEKLGRYNQESEAKSLELKEILGRVGLGDMAMEQALACFRVNLDKLLDTKVFLEQCREQEEAARHRQEQSRQELAALEQRGLQMMEELSVNSPSQVEMKAEECSRRKELEQEALNLEQRIQDLLEGSSETQLRQHAAASSAEVEYEDLGDLSQKMELLDEEILTLQSQKSEGQGRLEGLYSNLSTSAELEEEQWQLEEYSKSLELNLQALDLAMQTISELAEELNSQLAPELNHMVSSMVQRITGGKYHELQVAQDMSISVLTPEQDNQVDLGMLSGGTIDQFYFACRVAIADLVTGGGLPLFLDDSFVQYDDQRLQYMLKLLVELGSGRQIILLTCQQRELETLAALAPGKYKAINLEGQ